MKISKTLAQQFEDQPEKTFNLIVRTDGDATPRLKWLASEGIEVTRQFRLTPGVAVTCQGRDASRLLKVKWIRSIELDQEITTM